MTEEIATQERTSKSATINRMINTVADFVYTKQQAAWGIGRPLSSHPLAKVKALVDSLNEGPAYGARRYIDYVVRGNSIILIEREFIEEQNRWLVMTRAKLRQDPETAWWSLYWWRKTERWDLYMERRAIDGLLGEVTKDPWGCFWG